MKIKRMLIVLLSLPKTLYVNLKLFGLRGLRCPMLISFDTKLAHLEKGCVKLQKPSFACVKIGFDGTKGIVPVKSGGGYLEIRKGSQVEFMGKANFKHGNSIRVGGHFCVGDGFDSNVNCFFSCNNEIIIGEDCLLGWNVNIRDSDNHVVLVDGIKSPTEKSVVIGDHVWLCSYVDILKGVRIPNESIVAYRACVTRSFDESKILIGGVGGRILKHNVEWVH